MCHLQLHKTAHKFFISCLIGSQNFKPFSFVVFFLGVNGIHPTQRPSQWSAVPEKPIGVSLEYFMFVKNSRHSGGTRLLPEPLTL